MSNSSFIVLSPPRHGSSALAGALHRMGFSMGEFLQPADQLNRKGYYEDLKFQQLNKQLVGEGLFLSDIDQESLTTDQKQYIKQITSHHSIHNHWGIKDPRFCYTLPLFLDDLPNLKLIEIERDYQQAVYSLHRFSKIVYDGSQALSLKEAYDLMKEWFDKKEESIKKAKEKGIDVYTVNYKDLLEDTFHTLDDIAHFIDDSTEYNIDLGVDFIDPNLQTVKEKSKPIDIIIPFKRDDLIEKCVQSIKDHTYYSNVDIVTVDDRKGELGPVKAYNVGLVQSQNDVILMNDDIEVTDHWLSNMLQIDADIVYSQYDDTDYFKNISCTYIKRKVFNTIGGLDHDNWFLGFGADDDFFIRAKKHGFTFGINTANKIKHKHRASVSKHEKYEELKEQEREYFTNKYYNKKILVVVLASEWVKTQVFQTYHAMFSDQRHETDLIFSYDKPIEYNRNKIVKTFLEDEKEYDYLLMIDEDNPPQSNPLDLIELDLDVIGFPTPMRKNNYITWNVMNWNEEEQQYMPIPTYERHGLTKPDAVGTGCALIARRVLESIDYPFETVWGENGTMKIGNDFNFCQKIYKNGFKVYAHWDYICSHYKMVDLSDLTNRHLLQ